MAKNTSVVLGDHFERFVDLQVRSGRYSSASDVLRAGLRLLEEREERLEQLRNALIAGEQSGDAGPLDIAETKRRARRSVAPKRKRRA